MTEWLKVRDWKSRVRDERTEGSNPSLSAIMALLKATCYRGDVAQLGERCLRKAEVGGSSPLISTNPSGSPLASGRRFPDRGELRRIPALAR